MHQRASLPGVIRDRHTVLGGRSRNIRERVRAADTGEALRSFLFTVLRWTPRAAVGFVVGVVAVIAIFINALFMQPGLHPAPLFKPPAFESNPGHPAPKAAAGAPAQRGNPAPAPVMPKISHASRAPGEIITDIQQELAHRGYYDGPIDGLHGPRTEGAIRDFERAASLTPSALPSEALLHAIMRSPVRRENVHPARTAVAGPSASQGAIPPPPTRSLAQVLAVQRALSEFGYGQIRPTGTVDPDTRRAIAEFERERNLPISGQVSERLIRELSAATGRTLPRALTSLVGVAREMVIGTRVRWCWWQAPARPSQPARNACGPGAPRPDPDRLAALTPCP